MKNINYLLIISATALLSACGGSETYRGEWKATDLEGTELEITFYKKSFTLNSDKADSMNIGYSQNSVNIKNSVETYGIKVDDGRSYYIHFPIPDDESKGIMLDGNDNLMYTLGREDYLEYEDIYAF